MQLPRHRSPQNESQTNVIFAKPATGKVAVNCEIVLTVAHFSLSHYYLTIHIFPHPPSQFLAKNKFLLGSGRQFKAPHPILQVPNSTKHVLQGMAFRKLVFEATLPKKMAIFCPKMG